MPKLREYKGIKYDPTSPYPWIGLISVYKYAWEVCANERGFDDEDHAALLDLKKNPYEPNPTLEDVVNEWNEAEWVRSYESDIALGELCTMLRTAFPQIDTQSEDDFSPEPTLEEQMQYHVGALVDMGAKYYSGELSTYMEGYPRLVLPKVK